MKKLLVVLLTCLLLGTLVVPTFAAQQIVLNWWTHATLSQRDLYNQLIKQFEAEHPGVKINLVITSSWDDMWRKMLTAIAAGEGVDLARTKDFWVTDLASRGALLDLTPYIERDRAELEIDEYYADLMKAYQFNGGQYGLPWHVYFYNLYYNIDLFNEAGLPGPPETWDEIVEYGKKLTRPEKQQYATQLMAYEGDGAFLSKTMEMFARQNSEDPFARPWDVSASLPKFNVTDKSMVGALQFWIDAMYKEKIALPTELSALPQRVENGRIAFWYNSPIGASELRKTHQKLNFALAPNPAKYNRATVVEQNAFIAFKITKYPELTWELMKFLTSAETNLKYCLDGVYLPNRKAYWDQAPFNSDPDYLVARAQLSDPAAVHHSNYPVNWLQLMTVLGDEIENVLHRRKTPEAAMADAEKGMMKLMYEAFGEY